MRARQLLIVALTSALVLAFGDGTSAQGSPGRTPRTSSAAGSQSIPPPLPRAVERPATEDQSADRQAAELRAEVERFSARRLIFRFAQDYTLPADQVVREIRTVFSAVTIDGKVDGDVVAVLGPVEIAGTSSIRGSLVVIGANATIREGATVGGDLVVVGGVLDAPSTFSPQGEHVVIGLRGLGDAVQGIVPWFTRGLLWGRLIVPSLPWMWWLVGLLFAIGVVLNFLFDTPVKSAAGALATKPLSAFLTGLLVMLLAGPLLIVLAASVIGLIVVPFAACALIAASILGKIAVARAIGAGAVRESEEGNSRGQGFRSFVIGSAVLCLAYMVPIIGLLTWATTGALGLGAATMTFFAALRRERPPAVRPPEIPVTPAPSGAVTEATAGSSVVSAAAAWTPGPTLVDLEAPTPGAVAPAPAALPAGDLSVYARASFLDRLAAFALDCVLVAIANGFLDVRRGEGGVFFLLLLVYHIAFWAWKGTTLGGIIVGLRVVRAPGTELRFVDALVRGLSSIFSIAALGIGCFWMLHDPEKQMWHDKIAGTVVIKVPREMVLA